MKCFRAERRRALLGAVLAALLQAACGHTVARSAPGASPETTAVAYVVRRGWHSDIGFAVDAVHGPLAALAHDLSDSRYMVFGFGDRRYLQMSNKASGSVLAMLWPERGLILATGLKATPAEAFGAGNVVALRLSQQQIEDMADFVWKSLQQDPQGMVRPYANGPYADSLYYSSTRIYAGVRTCNTWTAQALRAAGLPVQSVGVVFAVQVWTQALRLGSDQ